MGRMIRWAVIIGVIVTALWAAGHYGGEAWRKATAPRYLVAAITRGRVENSVNSTGTVKPSRMVTVGSFVSGPVLQVKVDYNSPVEEGETLALIDPKLPEAALVRDKAAVARDKAAREREEANLATAEAERDRVWALMKQAERNEGRAEKLRAKNEDFISEAEMDQFKYAHLSLKAQLKVAEANINQAKAAVRAAAEAIKQSEANQQNSQANRDYCRIVSPVKGRIVERKVDPGQTVASAFQTPEMFVIAERMEEGMHVHASVDEADIGQILAAKKAGKPVRFTVDAWPGEVFTGKVHQVRSNATVTQNVVTYPVVILAPNNELKLMPSMTANISFEIEVREDVLRVPASALRFVPPAVRVRPEDMKYLEAQLQSGEAPKLSASQKAVAARSRSRRVVWVHRGNELHAVPVVLGLIDSQFAELLEGDLREDDEVVTGIDTARR